MHALHVSNYTLPALHWMLLHMHGYDMLIYSFWVIQQIMRNQPIIIAIVFVFYLLCNATVLINFTYLKGSSALLVETLTVLKEYNIIYLSAESECSIRVHQSSVTIIYCAGPGVIAITY